MSKKQSLAMALAGGPGGVCGKGRKQTSNPAAGTKRK